MTRSGHRCGWGFEARQMLKQGFRVWRPEWPTGRYLQPGEKLSLEDEQAGDWLYAWKSKRTP